MTANAPLAGASWETSGRTPSALWAIASRLALLLILFGLSSWLHLRDRANASAFSTQLLLGVTSIGFALSIGSLLLLRRGIATQAVSLGQILFDQLAWTVVVYVTGGITSGATSLYGLTILIAGVLFGLRGAVVSSLSALLFYSTLSAALLSRWLEPPSDQPPEAYLVRWASVAYPFTLTVLVIVVVGVLSGYLTARLAGTRGALMEATERARRAEELALIGRLASALAHEIRNPLGSIAGIIDMIATAPGLSEEDRLLCGIISRETARLNELVQDMLQLARPRAPEPSLVDLRAVASEVLTLASSSGRGGDVKLLLDAPERPLRASADAFQARQVIWNLLRNAIQASPPGATVTLRLREEDEWFLFLEVEDHGSGIPKEARERLFDAFFSTRAQGTGIGLAVVKRIADDHGWSLEVRSSEGQGTLFSVRIPVPVL